MTQPPPDQTNLKPGDPGHLGHKVSGGARHQWRPRTLRGVKRSGFFRNREAWPRFRETAGIDARITFTSAWRRAEVHPYTLGYYINGFVDPKLSTAIDCCEAWGCKLEGFARAMRESWEIAERRMQAIEAIEEARRL